MKKYEVQWQVVVQVDDWNVDIQQTGLYPEDGYILEVEDGENPETKAGQVWDAGDEMKLMGVTEEELLRLFEGEVGEDGNPITEIDELEHNNVVFYEEV